MPAYPWQTELVLAAFPSAVPCARLHAKLVIREWGLATVADDVETVVSELVTNAVRASEGLGDSQQGPPTLQMWLCADQELVLVQVWDASNQMPQRRTPDPEAASGRGLSIVEALSQDIGAYRLEGQNGKIVWSRLRVK